jgi:hypothetical protein
MPPIQPGRLFQPQRLLEFGLLVEHVLAGDRLEFLDLQLVRLRALVLGGGVEMTGAGASLQLDLLAHGDSPLRVHS